MARVFLACAAMLVISISLIGHWWLREPIRSAERSTGVDLPEEATRIHWEEVWSTFGGSGRSIAVYSLPESIGTEFITKCDSVGMKVGRLRDEAVRFQRIERYMSPESEICYRLWFREGMTHVVAVAQDKLVVYTFD